MSKIEIQDARAGVVFQALIGNCHTSFEIQTEAGSFYYLVGQNLVTREVFLDALELAKLDKFDPKDPQFRSEPLTVSTALPPEVPDTSEPS